MQKIELPLELVNALLVYLDRQPHGEVRRLMPTSAQITEAMKWGGVSAFLLVAQAVLPMGLDVLAGMGLAIAAAYGGYRFAKP